MKFLLALASALPLVFAHGIALSQTTPDPCDEQATCQAQKGAQLLALGRVEEAAVALEKAFPIGLVPPKGIGSTGGFLHQELLAGLRMNSPLRCLPHMWPEGPCEVFT